MATLTPEPGRRTTKIRENLGNLTENLSNLRENLGNHRENLGNLGENFGNLNPRTRRPIASPRSPQTRETKREHQL